MDEEAQERTEERTPVDAVLLALEQARKAHHGKRQQIVADDRLPARGVRNVEKQLQKAERERDKQARAKAPADAEQENREHRKRHRAAVRQLPKLEIAQHLRQSQQERALTQAAERHFSFCHEKHLRK